MWFLLVMCNKYIVHYQNVIKYTILAFECISWNYSLGSQFRKLKSLNINITPKNNTIVICKLHVSLSPSLDNYDQTAILSHFQNISVNEFNNHDIVSYYDIFGLTIFRHIRQSQTKLLSDYYTLFSVIA